jgi:hypothetical protein
MRIIIMTKLDRDTAKKIAEHFTTIQVWEMLSQDEIEKGNYENCRKWSDVANEAICALADDFGIELPTLSIARRQLRDGYKYGWSVDAA